MKKMNNVGIVFYVEVNGELTTLIVPVEKVRNSVEEAKKQKKKYIQYQFIVGDKLIEKQYEIKQLEEALIKTNLIGTRLVPKSLEGYLQDVTQKLCLKPIAPIAKREHELEKIWFYISQKVRNNVFITGEMDVGKTAIAHEIARQISTNECPKEFSGKRVLQLKPEQLSKIKSDRAYEREVRKVMNFLVENRKSIVIYIDNALYMKTDELLIMMLYAFIKKYNIPMIAALQSEYYDRYFAEDTFISKYLNEVYVRVPDKDEIRPMIDAHLNRFESRYKVKPTEEAIKFGIYTSCLSESPSYEPGNVISIFEKAFREARRKGKKYVDKNDILSCYNTYLDDYESTPEKEKRATAYHETGHYILEVMSEHCKDVKISCVSILPMMYWAGVTMSYFDKKEFAIRSREYFIDEIAMALAGRVAERRIIETNSTGASNDLEQVNAYAKAIVMKWGFSDKENNRNRSYDYEDYFLMPESKKELIDKEVQELIDAGMERAEKIISDNEGLLKVIAERLMVDEILTGEELEQICKEYEESNKVKAIEGANE